MTRTVVAPTLNEYGDETHPAFGLVQVNRVSAGGVAGGVGGGVSLFDSELKHNHFIQITFSRATRARDLNRDWIHGGSKMLFKASVSEAQWAQMISSLNTSGTPCTIEATETDWNVPEIPFAPRMAIQMEEMKQAADRMFADVREALETYKEHKTVGNLRNLEITLNNATPNVAYAAKALSEHTENTVAKAKADVVAMIDSRARQMGIDPVALDLDTGNFTEDVRQIEA